MFEFNPDLVCNDDNDEEGGMLFTEKKVRSDTKIFFLEINLTTTKKSTSAQVNEIFLTPHILLY